MTDRHQYQVTVTWTGNLGPGTLDYNAYSRSFELEAAGRHAIAGSSDPAFRGDEGRWNPEQLFVGSLSACHKLWFLHLAAVADVVVTAYVDHAEGVMVTAPGAETGCFTSVTLRPQVTLARALDADLLTGLHADAHRRCFLANSVNFPVTCEPSFAVATESAQEAAAHGR